MSDLNTRLRAVIGAEIDRGRQAEEMIDQRGWTSEDDAWDSGGPDAGHRYRLARQHMRTAHYATVLLELVDAHRPEGKLFEHSVVCSSDMCAYDFLHGAKRFTLYPCPVTTSIALQLGVPLDAPPTARLSLVRTAPQAPDKD